MINSIVEAIANAIYSEFGEEYNIYSDPAVQDLALPCFFILLINSTVKRVMDNRYFNANQFCIQYHPADELNPETEINDVSERLSFVLDDITVEGNIIHGKDIHTEIFDGVLSLFVNYDRFIYKTRKPAEKMEKISIRQTFKGGMNMKDKKAEFVEMACPADPPKVEVKTSNAPAFTKEQLISSKKYQHRRDALGVLLDDAKTYTISETDKILENFLKGKVK